jgi:hypothetical protein
VLGCPCLLLLTYGGGCRKVLKLGACGAGAQQEVYTVLWAGQCFVGVVVTACVPSTTMTQAQEVVHARLHSSKEQSARCMELFPVLASTSYWVVGVARTLHTSRTQSLSLHTSRTQSRARCMEHDAETLATQQDTAQWQHTGITRPCPAEYQ